MATDTVPQSSASEYLEHYNPNSATSLNELIKRYDIQNTHDVEQLINYAISYCKSNIINALFDYNNSGYADQLFETFKLHINSLYSRDCLSLIPKIKTTDNTNNKQNNLSNLFSQNVIKKSKEIEYDNQIQFPTTSVVSRSMLKHLITTNAHIKVDIHDLDFYSYPHMIALKPYYMSYFDHCMLLGHYKLGLRILELGGWNTFLNGNFMIYVREMIVTQLQSGKSCNKSNLIYYTNIVTNLYSMGADVDNIYHNRILNGLAYLYDIIKDSKGTFETRQMAFSKILQHYTNFTFDICFMLTEFVPYISVDMIQKLPHQRGMVLSRQ